MRIVSTTRSNVTVHCDACRRILHTQRTTTKGARGDARRAGWIVAAIYSGDASEDHAAKDMCPQCLRRRQAGAELYVHHWSCSARSHGVGCNCAGGGEPAPPAEEAAS